MTTDDFDRAIADWTEIVRLKPTVANPKTTLSEIYVERAKTYLFQRDYDRAIADCAEAIRLDANNAKAFAVRGDVRWRKNEYDLATADASEAIRLDPKKAHKDLLEKVQRSIRNAAAKTTPASRPETKPAPTSAGNSSNLTPVHHSQPAGTLPEVQARSQPQSEHDRVIAELTEAIRCNPNDSKSFDRRGDAYRKKGTGNYHKAIEDYTEAIRLNPGDTWAFAHRGETYQLKGDYDRAIADLTEAIRLNPKYAWAFACRGQTYRLMDDHDRAIADLSEAVKLDTSHSHLLSAAQEEARKKPSLSWPSGAYYCTDGSWHAMPVTEDEFVQLVKNKSITLDTLLVGVPDSLTPILMFSTPEEKKWFDSVVNPPSGLWKAVKVAGLVAGFAAGSLFRAVARYDAAPRGMALCLKCKSPVDPFATRCPFCQGDPREF